MIPLTMTDLTTENVIKKVGGNAQVKKHLNDLGFTAGANVSLINSINGNVIVCVKGVRIAISREMAERIMV